MYNSDMLYIFHGSDIDKSRDKAHSLLNSLRTKKPDASFVKVEADEWNAEMVKSHLEGQGLFSNKYIIFLDRVTEKTDARDELLDILPDMKSSANIFIILEAAVKAEFKKAFDKHAEKVVESELVESKVSTKKPMDVFALADALGSKDAFKSWSLYRQAVDSGIEAENIIGTLFWQAKSIMLAKNTSSASESGLNPFVYSKSKKYAQNFSDEGIKKLLTELITLYHDGHRGVVDLELSVERLMLSIQSRTA
jgi:DNA polymerase III delta subunit